MVEKLAFRVDIDIWSILEEVKNPPLILYLKTQNIQIQSFILSKLSDKKIKELLIFFTSLEIAQILKRLIKLRDIEPYFISILEEDLLKQVFIDFDDKEEWIEDLLKSLPQGKFQETKSLFLQKD